MRILTLIKRFDTTIKAEGFGQIAYLDADQTFDVLGLSLTGLQVPKHHTSLGPIWLAESIHYGAREVTPVVGGLHIREVYKGLYCQGYSEAPLLPRQGIDSGAWNSQASEMLSCR